MVTRLAALQKATPLGAEALAPRSLTILGSTGSIGRNAISLVEHAPARFRIEALTAQDNVAMLAQQARRLRPKLAVIGNEAHFSTLREALAGTGIRAAAGVTGLIEAAALPAEMVLSAIVGAAGLPPTLEAIRRGAMIALANKECLVSGGALLTRAVKDGGAKMIPVDSEHSAIFQVFNFERPEWVEAITITASGGPFRHHTLDDMRHVTPEEAVRHPNWRMGAKISVDSATLMNKGLELIEAYHLFPVSEGQLDVLIHPESIVHSLVSFIDGSVLAQMGQPDMRTPIAYALSWPERMPTPVDKLDLRKVGALHFEAVDDTRFPALRLAREALRQGGAAPAILSAANEVAVARFLAGQIGFLDIVKVIEKTLHKVKNSEPSSLDDVLEKDREARETAVAL